MEGYYIKAMFKPTSKVWNPPDMYGVPCSCGGSVYSGGKTLVSPGLKRTHKTHQKAGD